MASRRSDTAQRDPGDALNGLRYQSNDTFSSVELLVNFGFGAFSVAYAMHDGCLQARHRCRVHCSSKSRIGFENGEEAKAGAFRPRW